MTSGCLWDRWTTKARCGEACLCFALLLAGPATARGQNAATEPVVSFTLDFPGSEPDHYAISVAADGRGTYESTGRVSAQAASGDTFRREFTLSEANRGRVFDLAKRAHYFEGTLDSKKKGLASTGVKTLAYRDARTSTQASYNYSFIPPVQDLTQLFQNLSTTLEFGHRLEYYHRYQKLALDEETKRMEEMARDKELVEIGAVAEILRQVANDTSVINVVRLRAQRLLAQSESSSP